jgi:hypothetical protein
MLRCCNIERRGFLSTSRAGLPLVQDFTGVCGFSAVNSLMIKRALLVALGFLALCFPVAAQQNNRTNEFDAAAALALYRPEIFASVDSSVLVRDLPMLTFLDGRLPGSTALGRMGTAPLDVPSLAYMSVAYMNAAKVRRVNASRVSGKDGKDSSAEVMSSPSSPYYWGGEVGFFYGHSSGKFGGDEFGTYIDGVVGNDKFQINAGASYQEWNGRAPRRIR